MPLSLPWPNHSRLVGGSHDRSVPFCVSALTGSTSVAHSCANYNQSAGIRLKVTVYSSKFHCCLLARELSPRKTIVINSKSAVVGAAGEGMRGNSHVRDEASFLNKFGCEHASWIYGYRRSLAEHAEREPRSCIYQTLNTALTLY